MFRLLLAALAFAWTMFFASDDGDDNGNDDGNNDDANDSNDSGKPKSDAKWTDKDLSKYKGDARKEGKATGEKSVLEALGFESIDDAKQRFATFQAWEEDEKTELDKAADCIDKLTKRAETEKERAGKAEAELKRMQTNEAIADALDEANFSGKRPHALRAIDRSQVKETDDGFDASEAVKALSEDGFPGFEEPEPSLNDPPTLERRRRKQGDQDQSKTYKPNYSRPG